MLLLTKCPKCHQVVSVNPLGHSEVIVQCAFCGYKDWSSSFVGIDDTRSNTSEQSIINAWAAIKKSSLNSNNVDLYIEEVSEKYGVNPITVVELINMSIRLKQSTNSSSPICYSNLKGDDILLHELLRNKDDYHYYNRKENRIVIEPSSIELESYRDKLELLSRDNDELKKRIGDLMGKLVELKKRLSKYEIDD